MKRLLALLIAAAVALAVTSAATPMAPVKLTGTVGPGFTITLKSASGKLVKRLKAGRYTFVIHDKASIHSYGLDGPKGFAKDFTTVPFVGTKTFTLTLKKGKYKYYCRPHESSMFGFFVVV